MKMRFSVPRSFPGSGASDPSSSRSGGSAASDPSSCPSCARQYCLQCITKWFGTKRAQTSGGIECPNCQSKLPLENLVQCASEVNDTLASACEPALLTNGAVGDVCNGSALKLSNGTPSVEKGTIRVVVKVLESDADASPQDGHPSPPSRNGTPTGAMLTNGSSSEQMHPPVTNGKQHGKRKDNTPSNRQSSSPLSNGAGTEMDTAEQLKKPGSGPLENGRNRPKLQPIICNGVHPEPQEPSSKSADRKHNHVNGRPTVTFEEPKATRRNGYRHKHTTDSEKAIAVEKQSSPPAETTPIVEPRDTRTPDRVPSEDVNRGMGDSLCPTHALPMLFFCLSCNGCICETCALHDDTHAEHTFKKITTMYDSKVEKIRHEFGGIKEYLADVGTVLRAIEQNIDWVRASKARKLQELSQLLHTEAENIERQIQAKLTLLQRQKDS
uniref:B box-type domain-containing protein n=1 Tax=Anopheles maculatus TaxID=74869 RepID=A0A182T5P1_9DIPT